MSSEPADQSQSSFPIVGVGASAGGLAQILGRATSLPVREVTNNQPVQADHVYVIPPGTNLSLAQGVLKLQPLN